jgi:hypothetical protein
VVAKTYNVRPSALAGLDPRSLEAWELDQATATFCNALTDELESVKDKNEKIVELQRQRILEKWLSPGSGESTPTTGQFKDPAVRMKE